jgi:hypothetical protein
LDVKRTFFGASEKCKPHIFWGFDLRGHRRVKNKKESIDGLGAALVSVAYITPRSFL